MELTTEEATIMEEVVLTTDNGDSIDLFEDLDSAMSRISSLAVPDTVTTTTTTISTNSHHQMQQNFRWKKSNGHEESFPVTTCSDMLELWVDSAWFLHKTAITIYCENLYCNLSSRLGALVYHMQDEVLRKLVARYCVAHSQQRSHAFGRNQAESVQNLVSVANISLRGEIDPTVLDKDACIRYGQLTSWSRSGGDDDDDVTLDEDSTQQQHQQQEQLIEAPVMLDSWEYYWGNIFFAWWRQNKEHYSVTKYISALKIHHFMTILLDKLIENSMKTTTKLRLDLVSLCDTKRKEAVEALIWRGDPKGANFQYTMWHWGRGQLQRLNEYWDLIVSSMNALNDVKVQIAQLISKCSLRLLYKDEKLQIRALLKTSVLHDIGVILLDFEEWFRINREATGITLRTQNRLEKIDTFSPLIITAATPSFDKRNESKRTNDKGSGGGSGGNTSVNQLLEKYHAKLSTSCRWFTDRGLKANHDKIICWVLEDFGSTITDEDEGGGGRGGGGGEYYGNDLK